MATTCTLIEPTYREPVTGYSVRRYTVQLATGSTAFTLSDTAWSDVVDLRCVPTTTSAGVGEVIWDGSDVKGAGYTATDKLILTVVGRF